MPLTLLTLFFQHHLYTAALTEVTVSTLLHYFKTLFSLCYTAFHTRKFSASCGVGILFDCTKLAVFDNESRTNHKDCCSYMQRPMRF